MKRPKKHSYLHGYSKKEQFRLYKQAKFLEPFIYSDVDLKGVKNLIEVGCGVGAQTAILLKRFPHLHITGVDASDRQLRQAGQYLKKAIRRNRVELLKQNALNLKVPAGFYDGAFLCWFLEHVPDSLKVLKQVKKVLKPGGTIHCCEVQNSSFFVDPYSPAILKYWFQFNDEQWMMKGDPFVGAKLGNLLKSAGFKKIQITVKPMLFDSRWVKERGDFMRNWTELLLSAAPALLASKRVNQKLVDQMKKELDIIRRTKNSVLFFSWVQARAEA